MLMPAEWSMLIAKAQAGDVPSNVQFPALTIAAQTPDVSSPSVPSKIFTVEAMSFSLEPEPGALPDCLVQMALNCVFIPLSILTTIALNNIEMDQNVKYKHITYGSGAGNTFLDEFSFPTEDQLRNFEFGQAYMNWLTLIETMSDPVVKQCWHTHHK